jgi:hypothetical protein
MLCLCCAYLNAHYQVVIKGLWLSCQMFVLVFWSCSIPICDGDIGNSLMWLLLAWHFKGGLLVLYFVIYVIFYEIIKID